MSITIYLIVSAILLGWMSAIWSSQRGINLLMKLTYAAVAVCGAGMAIVRLGWLS